MAHEDYQDMLAAQALKALEAAEMRDLEAHLQSCAECRLQLSEWEDTAAGLAFASLEGTLSSRRSSYSTHSGSIRADSTAPLHQKPRMDIVRASNVTPFSQRDHVLAAGGLERDRAEYIW